MRIPANVLIMARAAKNKSTVGRSLSGWLSNAISERLDETVSELVGIGLGLAAGEPLDSVGWMLHADDTAALLRAAEQLGVAAPMLLRICVARQAKIESNVPVREPIVEENSKTITNLADGLGCSDEKAEETIANFAADLDCSKDEAAKLLEKAQEALDDTGDDYDGVDLVELAIGIARETQSE
jgi:hypothetical protein